MINPASSALVEGHPVGANSCRIEEAISNADLLECAIEDADSDDGDELILTVCGHVRELAKELKRVRAKLESQSAIVTELLSIDVQELPREFADKVMKWRRAT